MDLYHYSEYGLGQYEDRTYEQKPSAKPEGLWVSVEGLDDDTDSWPEWCRGEEFRLECLDVRQRITLTDDANILTLGNVLAIDMFTENYTVEDPHPALRRYHWYIDWPRLAQRYQGIIIAPYQWERRNAVHTHWYYGWDCASGCIWDMTAIAKVE